MQLSVILCLVALVCPTVLAAPSGDSTGQIWAVLVAGSNTYYNYRHQSDVCHAYQLFHRNGVPDSNIIVMMYDDIANNTKNPDPGTIYNKPNGPNVYGPKAVPKDYTGENVTVANFINVLTGNAEAVKGVGSGKVLQSGPNDYVFINYVDHGAPGLVEFPSGILYASDLIKTLKTMNAKSMYKELVFYMEACESGSMFYHLLPSNINVLAATAANPTESSYACYWNSTIGAYLGDQFSVSWMEDTEQEEESGLFSLETLWTQYKHVLKKVTKSHPMLYGQTKMIKDDAKEFQGYNNSSSQTYSDTPADKFQDSVSSRDVVLMTLNKNIATTKNANEKKALLQEKKQLIQGRKTVDHLFTRILAHVTRKNVEDVEMLETSRQPVTMEMMDCYKTLVESFRHTCVDINKNTYALEHLYKFVNLCSLEYTSTDAVLEAFNSECTKKHRALTDVNS